MNFVTELCGNFYNKVALKKNLNFLIKEIFINFFARIQKIISLNQ